MAKKTETANTAESKTSKIEFDTARFEKAGKDLVEAGRNVWLAGLGAFAEVETQGKDLFEDLVKKGETFETRYRKGIDEAVDKTEKRASKVREWVENTAEKSLGGASDTFTSTLHRLGVPTHEDIRTLSDRVESLSAKVEALATK